MEENKDILLGKFIKTLSYKEQAYNLIKDAILFNKFRIGAIYSQESICNELGIKHQLIRPRTPRHNGKVEKSHRNDNKRFYNNLSFYSYDDLIKQMKKYLYRSNRLPMQTLNWLSPIEKRKQLMEN